MVHSLIFEDSRTFFFFLKKMKIKMKTLNIILTPARKYLISTPT